MELVGGRKLQAKLVILADGVHSKTAQKYHKMPLKHVDVGGWRYILLTILVISCSSSQLCGSHGIMHLRDVFNGSSSALQFHVRPWR